jgi:hypothetical protein
MNGQPVNEKQRTGLVYGLTILGAFLIVAALVWTMHHYTQPPPLNAARAAERAQALAEMRAQDADALEHAAWIDQAKGIVRLPIDDAMKIIESEWQNHPAMARSNLIERVEKATAPPPKAPEKPNPFE